MTQAVKREARILLAVGCSGIPTLPVSASALVSGDGVLENGLLELHTRFENLHCERARHG